MDMAGEPRTGQGCMAPLLASCTRQTDSPYRAVRGLYPSHYAGSSMRKTVQSLGACFFGRLKHPVV